MNITDENRPNTEEFRRQLKQSLENRLWDTVDEIGHGGYSCTRNFTDDMWAAYARGVKSTLDSIAENQQIDLPTHQIYGALGERLRRIEVSASVSPSPGGEGRGEGGRVTPKRSPFRAINNLLDKIRDHRIAILDQYSSLDRDIERDCDRKLRAFNHRFDPGEDRELESEHWLANETIRNELRALRELYTHLLSDRGWFAKHYESRPTTKLVQEAA